MHQSIGRGGSVSQIQPLSTILIPINQPPWPPQPPLACSERCQPTAGKTHCAPLTHTPPPALRREGNHDHGPAPGKLRSRSHTQRQPNSAMPTAMHRQTMMRPGDPKDHTEDPPTTSMLSSIMIARHHPTLPRASCRVEAKKTTATSPTTNGIFHRLQHSTNMKRTTLISPFNDKQITSSTLHPTSKA